MMRRIGAKVIEYGSSIFYSYLNITNKIGMSLLVTTNSDSNNNKEVIDIIDEEDNNYIVRKEIILKIISIINTNI